MGINCKDNAFCRKARRSDPNLKESAGELPGCLSYSVAKGAADAKTIWVTEGWDSMDSQDASLSLPVVKNAVPLGSANDRFELREDSRHQPGVGSRVTSGLRPLI